MWSEWTYASWRREWDSNPRYGCPYTRFPSVRLQPLGHPSGAPLSWRRRRHFARDGRTIGGDRPLLAVVKGRSCFPRVSSPATAGHRGEKFGSPRSTKSALAYWVLRLRGGRHRRGGRETSNECIARPVRRQCYSAACCRAALRRRQSIRKSVSITSPKLE